MVTNNLPIILTLKGYEAKIHVDPNVQPRFHRARPIPYSIRDKVEAELK